ncbi:transcriptional regulator [Mucilaginibacter sp.]|uniref:transcriptional regulator n=1 Tax=Mucilaginibacter sp. TaxID=1882438 RepID=UPI00263168DD|nr:transcriptional regulator [Mucilaginibacter sp.]MDB4925315.1 putative transcription activator [Mucilaginibacter sp.]
METTTLDKDIKVCYITAASFPDGILAAHQKLHSLIPFSTNRKYFGVSRPENGPIVYRAAAEELEPGEAEKLNLDTLILKKGNYISLTVHDYMRDIPAIDRTFKQLLSQPNLDPQGYCVEWYLSDKDVKCMIRLNN